jgi:hypothetical protein
VNLCACVEIKSKLSNILIDIFNDIVLIKKYMSLYYLFTNKFNIYTFLIGDRLRET